MGDISIWLRDRISRRGLLSGGLAAAGGTTICATSVALGQSTHGQHKAAAAGPPPDHAGAHGAMITVGEVDDARNGFDPSVLLTEWDIGTVSRLPDGRTLRTFEVTAEDKEIEIAPGIMFPAWTYNGRVPGPSLRATEGDHLRIVFKNSGSHPHSMHFHGIHAARMDGVPGAGLIDPGDEFVYEFDARPFGCHLYHCHALPLKRHIHKGMYGAFVIDPDPARHPDQAEIARSRLFGTLENAGWQEFVMVMNAFDTNFDNENEVYAVNTVAHAFMKRPIKIVRDRPVRIYLVNVVEFDPINSFHLHANFFDYYEQGTTLVPTLRTVDLITQVQAQRGILEFTYRDHETGLYMFHPHQSEFTELGWAGMFDVVEAVA
ncbi:multicopper oxidase domain-containing protein [Mesorhizobium sp. ZC-5]|uniref:multicopper oxidase domain-containing protein n=1 Tax=Mesorhizobium sp. ZC-5 TaxID=2986066 RepID=UPI0021E8A318|nr:multicopper oxidase domain-containing protein [Mesorhizobium sp. ZC-5]MCV3239762.1 multicopper oxidase domain-containing protein [Mesorhizobium sp. ZC-5]